MLIISEETTKPTDLKPKNNAIKFAQGIIIVNKILITCKKEIFHVQLQQNFEVCIKS